MCMEDGEEDESTVISWALKWRENEKLDRLGTVNSDARNIIVGAKEHMFAVPPMAPDMGGDYYWEQFFVDD